MESIFLIGGSGFIGKNLVEYLSEKYNVTVVDKYIDEEFFKRYPLVETIKIDLVEEHISEGYATPDYIINLASIVTAERDFSLFDGLISTNLKVLLNLYERYKDDKRLKLFIQFGSSEEYGSEGSPFVESMREQPSSPYALVKQLTVNTALMLHANYGFPAMVVRPGNLFGKYQNKAKFIPYVISQLKAGQPLDVTPCEQKRDFISATDFAWCIGKLLENYTKCRGDIVNVSSGKSMALKDIIELSKGLIGSNSEVNYGARSYRENEVMDLRCSVHKLEKIIKSDIAFDMEKSLEELINNID
jgi:nucleoside-diphosphate-sugar epimerase